MPEYRRTYIPGAVYFFTVTTWRRQKSLLEEPVRFALREAITLTRRQWPFTIDAWVLLPDHLHCVWTLPQESADFSLRWGLIKRHVSQMVGERFSPSLDRTRSRLKRHESGLWQRRFWEHLIRDETDYRRHIDYIHWNPVKHNYLKQAGNWPYSTFHRFVERSIYPPDWGGIASIEVEDEFGE